MSEFWNCSEPPAQADIIAWCEKEVETACMDMLANLAVMGWWHNGPIAACPFVGGDWELDSDNASRPLTDLLREACDSHVSWASGPNKRGVHGLTAERMESEFQAIEAEIAEFRAIFKPEDLSDAQPNSGDEAA